MVKKSIQLLTGAVLLTVQSLYATSTLSRDDQQIIDACVEYEKYPALSPPPLKKIERFFSIIQDYPWNHNLAKLTLDLSMDQAVVFFKIAAATTGRLAQTSLNLEACNIVSMPHLLQESEQQLKELNLSYNRLLDTSSLTAFKKLVRLSLQGNPITDVRSLASLRHLEFLDLSGTRVQRVEPLKALPNLVHLFLSETVPALAKNQEETKGLFPLKVRLFFVRAYNQSFVNGTRDRDLMQRVVAYETDPSANPPSFEDVMHFLKSSQDYQKANLQEQLPLDLPSNLSRSLNSLAKPLGASIGLPVDELHLFDLSRLKIDTLPRFLNVYTQLHMLFLSNNYLNDITPLSPLFENLRLLDLGNNRLSQFNWGPFPQLVDLNLSYNFLGSVEGITGKNFPSVKSINLSGNHFQDSTPLASVQTLVNLDLCQTSVTTLEPLGELPGLGRIYLNATEHALEENRERTREIFMRTVRIRFVSKPNEVYVGGLKTKMSTIISPAAWINQVFLNANLVEEEEQAPHKLRKRSTGIKHPKARKDQLKKKAQRQKIQKKKNQRVRVRQEQMRQEQRNQQSQNLFDPITNLVWGFLNKMRLLVE